ncbi:hypothetical protein X755_06550 [Mesorhizobium sp. LNJC405B00]|nr:hypothetical protein X755_06550 [Mesorhizobium sp. LNJC405B00]
MRIEIIRTAGPVRTHDLQIVHLPQCTQNPILQQSCADIGRWRSSSIATHQHDASSARRCPTLLHPSLEDMAAHVADNMFEFMVVHVDVFKGLDRASPPHVDGRFVHDLEARGV